MSRPASSLPDREGVRPRTTPTNPHSQLDQHPSPEVLSELTTALFALPHVREAPSAISVPGARGLWLDPSKARGPREAFLVGTEFAHVHPSPDGSLHAALPPSVAAKAVAHGWAEVHPMARRGVLPHNVVMVYAPRDQAEIGVVLQLIGAALAFALGTHEKGPAAF
jgi:luciferase-like monooxygenase